MRQLQIGDIAPLFELPSTEGKSISLSSFRGRATVVLLFYGRNDCMSTTKEACNFAHEINHLLAMGVKIIGISCDSMDNHTRFSTQYKIPFPILCDRDKMVARAYGVLKGDHASRTTFVIDRDGIIRKIYAKVNVDVHHMEIEEYIQDTQDLKVLVATTI